MTREEAKIAIRKAHHNIDDPLGELDKAIDKIIDKYEAEIEELKWDFDTQKKLSMEIYSKNENIDMLEENASHLFNALVDERKGKLCLFDSLKKEKKKARSIVATLFWEWRKAKENYNALYQYDKGIVEGMRYSFQKAYEMLKDKQ